jgi:N-acetylglucosaminyldiphosphoundecaprenol N-acetyl-beta-D-mannosaminyltransferase
MEKIHLLGFDFWDASDEKEVVHALVGQEANELFAKDNVNFLITPNAYDIGQYHTKYKHLYLFFRHAGVVLPDGMPIVWLSHLRKKSLRRRIPGSDLFPPLWSAIIQQRKKVFFILSNRALGEQLIAENQLARYAVPAVFDEEDDEYIRDFVQQNIVAIRDWRPEFIFIGITLPKQQKMAIELHRQLSGIADFNCLVCMLGASFEFYSGAKKRAPIFFRRTGLEWLYRFCQEPKRTWRRYTIGNLVFLAVAIRDLLGLSGAAHRAEDRRIGPK